MYENKQIGSILPFENIQNSWWLNFFLCCVSERQFASKSHNSEALPG